MTTTARHTEIEAAARQHSRALWGLCYRMTGDAAEAEDLVQETLTRALERESDVPVERWLAAVAMNLARDRLRQRRRQSYPGPWLPSAIETSGERAAPVLAVLPEHTPAGRYELLESVSFAFLMALEALTPQQRAVLILRDVFEYSVRETATCLNVSEASVKTTHLRARRAMESYDRTERKVTPAKRGQTQEALMALLQCLGENDFTRAEALLSPSVKSLSDGGGEFFAANIPVLGLTKVLKFFSRLQETRGVPERLELREINGLPAVLGTYEHVRHREPPRFLMFLELDEQGRIAGLHSILSSRKLHAIRF